PLSWTLKSVSVYIPDDLGLFLNESKIGATVSTSAQSTRMSQPSTPLGSLGSLGWEHSWNAVFGGNPDAVKSNVRPKYQPDPLQLVLSIVLSIHRKSFIP